MKSKILDLQLFQQRRPTPTAFGESSAVRLGDAVLRLRLNFAGHAPDA